MVTRRAGGVTNRPYNFTRGDFTYRVSGVAGKAFTTIRLLNRGAGRVFAPQTDDRKRQLKNLCVQVYINALIQLVPVRTGKLRASIRFISGAAGGEVSLGPAPREIRRSRRTGRNYAVEGWYARYANRRSSRSGYIERAGTQAAPRQHRLIRDYNRTVTSIDDAMEIQQIAGQYLEQGQFLASPRQPIFGIVDLRPGQNVASPTTVGFPGRVPFVPFATPVRANLVPRIRTP